MGHFLSPEQSDEKREARRQEAADQFLDACGIAAKAGLVLVCHTDAHYQLRDAGHTWIINIYPGNRRLYHDTQKRGPYLHVRDEWTLLEVVHAASRATKRDKPRSCCPVERVIQAMERGE